MTKNKKNLVLCIALFSYTSVQSSFFSSIKDHMQSHQQQALTATVVGLLARPAYNLVAQWCQKVDKNPYSLLSLLGYKCGVKPATEQFDEQFRGQFSLGSADVTVKSPTNLKEVLENIQKALCDLPAKCKTPKRSAEQFFDFLTNFYPKLIVAIEDQTSPTVRDKEAGVPSTVKRLFAKFSCGKFEFRSGVDLSEAVMIPASMIASYLLYQASQTQN